MLVSAYTCVNCFEFLWVWVLHRFFFTVNVIGFLEFIYVNLKDIGIIFYQFLRMEIAILGSN